MELYDFTYILYTLDAEKNDKLNSSTVVYLKLRTEKNNYFSSCLKF